MTRMISKRRKTSGEQRDCGNAEKKRNDKNQNPEGNSTLPEFLEPGSASLIARGCNISHWLAPGRVRKTIAMAQVEYLSRLVPYGPSFQRLRQFDLACGG